jgi:hypothetical protein
MPLDLQRLARVRAHLMAAAALATAGCGGSATPEHTINEPVHINEPPTPQPTVAPTPDQPSAGPAQTDPPQPSASPTAQPASDAKPTKPTHVNKPRSDKP